MPVSWEILDSVLALRNEGEYEAKETAQTVVEVMGAPSFRPGLFILLDSRLSKAKVSTTAEIDMLANWIASLPKLGFGSRFAFVVNQEAYRFVLARMLSIKRSTEGVDVMVFRDVGDGLEWLRRGA
jgi:hypothetical protein